jgi:hypothetical protein
MINLKDILNEKIEGGRVICDECGWNWAIEDGTYDGETNPYLCHKCGNDNTPVNEDLNKWFKEKWVNIGKKVDGKHPPCGTSGKKSGYAKCVPAAKAAGMSKKEKESATRRKRAAQNKADRGGKSSSGQGKTPIYVSTDKKNEGWTQKYKNSIDCNNPKGFSQKAHCQGKKKNETMKIEEKLNLFLEKNCPTDKAKWAASKAAAKSKFDVYPSAYANGWAAKNYKEKGGGWRKCNESLNEGSSFSSQHFIKKLTPKIEKDVESLKKEFPKYTISLVKSRGDNSYTLSISGKNTTDSDDNKLEKIISSNIKEYMNEDCWDGYKNVGGKMKNGKMVPNCVPINEASNVYTDWEENVNPDYILVTLKNGRKLKIEKKRIKGGQQMYRAILNAFNDEKHAVTDKIVNAMAKQLGENTMELNCDENGNCWEMEPPPYQSTSMGYREMNESDCGCSEQQIKEGNCDCDESIEEYDVETLEEMRDFVKFMKGYNQLLSEATCPCLLEAEYQGRNVKLGKIMQGDVKKFKVYVKNDKGNVVKVNFGFGGKSAGGKRMVIKKNNPERRKNFRARHNCDSPGPRWKARYWACRTW